MLEHIEKIAAYMVDLSFDEFKEQGLEYDAICIYLNSGFFPLTSLIHSGLSISLAEYPVAK